jgi:hypothetical protein
MLFAFPLPFAQELDAGAIHQQLQRGLGSLAAQFDLQGLLAPADRAEGRYRPVQLGQSHKTLHHAQRCRKGCPNRHLMLRQNWIAASEKVGLCPRLPVGAPNHCMPASSHIVNEPRAFKAALYVVRLPVRRAVLAWTPVLRLCLPVCLRASAPRFVRQSRVGGQTARPDPILFVYAKSDRSAKRCLGDSGIGLRSSGDKSGFVLGRLARL